MRCTFPLDPTQGIEYLLHIDGDATYQPRKKAAKTMTIQTFDPKNDPKYQIPAASALTAEFTTQNLTEERGWITYTDATGQERHILHRSDWPTKGMAGWMRKNITPADFYAAKAAKVDFLRILEGTGYVLPHIRRWMKEEGLNWKIAADVEEFHARQVRARQA